jgi:polyisoprenoid-binding protein YceI
MRTFPVWAAIFVATVLTTSSGFAGERYEFDQKDSKIKFQISHLFGKARGQFHRFSGTIDLDREQPERSSVSAKIDVGSIDTGIKKRDDHLRSPEFFDAEKFPAITFKSKSVKRTGERAGDVTGDLTMHGVTREIVLHVQMLPAGNERTYWKVSTAPLNRRDFNLMFSGTAEAVSGIGKEVAVSIEISSARPR